MRGIVWSQMIKMIIVIAVVVIMFQMFSFAFGQGTNVLTGGLDWLENKTGIGIGPRGSDVSSVSFSDGGPGVLEYVIDLPSRRENTVVVEFHVADRPPETVRIDPDDDTTIKEGTLEFDEPAVYVEAIIKEETGSGDVLSQQSGIAVNLRKFESGIAGGIAEGMVRGLSEDLAGSGPNPNPSPRTDRALDVLKAHCNMPEFCKAPYTGASEGLSLSNAKAAARPVFDNCVDLVYEDECQKNTAVLSSWLYCTLGSRLSSQLDTRGGLNQLLSTSVASSSSCPVDSIEESDACFEPPFSRSLSCDQSKDTVWRYS